MCIRDSCQVVHLRVIVLGANLRLALDHKVDQLGGDESAVFLGELFRHPVSAFRQLAECADWVAEQLTEEYGGFIAAELIDFVIEGETEIRAEHDDPQMDHLTTVSYTHLRAHETVLDL